MPQDNIDKSITFSYNSGIMLGGEAVCCGGMEVIPIQFPRRTPYKEKKPKSNRKKLYDELKEICEETMEQINRTYGCYLELNYLDFDKAILEATQLELVDGLLNPIIDFRIKLSFDLTDPSVIKLTSQFIDIDKSEKLLEDDRKDIWLRTQVTLSDGEVFRFDEHGDRI